MNKCFLIGRLTKDPDLRYTNSGKEVCNFTLAVDGYGERTDFIKITAWGKTAKNVAEYMEKGRMCAVAGELHIDKKEEKYYTSVNANQVKFLGGGRKKKETDDDLQEGDFDVDF